MITLGSLERRRDAKRSPKRVGRGPGSGRGGHTSTRGMKGQGSRAGGGVGPQFEGGQMPLQRRLPKRGFNNPLAVRTEVVNVDRLIDFKKGTTVDIKMLKAQSLISSDRSRVKILGEGNLKHAITVKVHAFSKSAKKKIEAAGGKVEVVRGRAR